MEDLTFGEQVKVVLSRKGMTIKELAEIIEEKTGMKMSRQNLTQRLGRDNFQEQDMRMIASILDCPFQLSILGGESAELTPADLRTVEEMRRKEGKLEDGEPTLEEMQIELPLEELKPHEEEENQERTIEEIAKDIPISSVMKRAEEEDAKREDQSVGDINPYTGHEYQSNSVRMHPSRIGYVQVYDRRTHKWKDMTEWAFLGEQERKKAMLEGSMCRRFIWIKRRLSMEWKTYYLKSGCGDPERNRMRKNRISAVSLKRTIIGS